MVYYKYWWGTNAVHTTVIVGNISQTIEESRVKIKPLKNTTNYKTQILS